MKRIKVIQLLLGLYVYQAWSTACEEEGFLEATRIFESDLEPEKLEYCNRAVRFWLEGQLELNEDQLRNDYRDWNTDMVTLSAAYIRFDKELEGLGRRIMAKRAEPYRAIRSSAVRLWARLNTRTDPYAHIIERGEFIWWVLWINEHNKESMNKTDSHAPAAVKLPTHTAGTFDEQLLGELDRITRGYVAWLSSNWYREFKVPEYIASFINDRLDTWIERKSVKFYEFMLALECHKSRNIATKLRQIIDSAGSIEIILPDQVNVFAGKLMRET